MTAVSEEKQTILIEKSKKTFKIGQQCLARYSEDGYTYPAIINQIPTSAYPFIK